MQPRLTILSLWVNNLEVSNHFYEHVFGWKKTDASNENISFFQLNGILLWLYWKQALAEDAWISHKWSWFKAFTIAYNVNSKQEVDELIQELKHKWVKIVKEPQEVFWWGYSSYIADPDENLWEIAYNPYLQMDADGNILAS